MDRWFCTLLIFALGGCRTPVPPVSAAAVTIPEQGALMNIETEVEPAAQATDTNTIIIPLEPGFTPSPHIAPGITGGSMDASTLEAGCIGGIGSAPHFHLEAQRDFASLSILVTSDGDTTLVVQRPNGTYLCNDDTEGLNPVVRGHFPAGTYRIWVGHYDSSAAPRFRLGISEDPSILPSGL